MKFYNAVIVVIVFGLLSTITHAQDDEPLVLTSENVGQTFVIRTGIIVRVQVPMFDAQISYNPAVLQFIGYTPPPNAALGSPPLLPSDSALPGALAEPIVIQPDGSVVPGDPVIVLPDSVPPGAPAEPIIIQPGGSVGSSDTGLVLPSYLDGGIVIDQSGTWDFLAIGTGETMLELRSSAPPCPENQPCAFMPEISYPFYLIVNGEHTRTPDDTMTTERTVIPIGEGMIGQAMIIDRNQMLAFDFISTKAPSNITYSPDILQLKSNEGRWLFEAVGHGETRLIVHNGEALLVDVQVIVVDNAVNAPLEERIMMQVDTVEVTVLFSNPPQLSIHVQGGIGSCMLPVQIDESHDASTVTIEIYVDAPTNQPCPEIWQMIDETFSLADGFAGDQVTIRVNDYITTVNLR